MYDRNMRELVNNGKMIQSSENNLKGLKEMIELLEEKIRKCGKIQDQINAISQLQSLREQYYIMLKKRDRLLKNRDEIIMKLCSSYKNESGNDNVPDMSEFDIIDKLIMDLLTIDDKYMEIHKTSNLSIMSFIEKLLKKKKTLISDK